MRWMEWWMKWLCFKCRCNKYIKCQVWCIVHRSAELHVHDCATVWNLHTLPGLRNGLLHVDNLTELWNQSVGISMSVQLCGVPLCPACRLKINFAYTLQDKHCHLHLRNFTSPMSQMQKTAMVWLCLPLLSSTWWCSSQVDWLFTPLYPKGTWKICFSLRDWTTELH